MSFKLIDKEKWVRREYFEHYFSSVPCTFSMTVKLDITKVKESNEKFYPKILHLLSQVVNNHDEFRTAINNQGQVGIYDQLNPSYTIFHKDSETFSNIWTQYSADYEEFYQSYLKDQNNYGHIKKMQAKPNPPKNVYTVSMIPWESFESFNLNLQKGYDYLLPIFTLGKYYQENGKYILPLAIQVHHAVCDGFHVARFLEELRGLLEK